MLKKTIKIAKFLIIGLLLLLLVLPAGTGNAKSHKSRGRSVGAAHSYVYKSKKASKSYRASNSGSRSGRKTKVSYRPKARVAQHKAAPKRKSYPRKSSPKRMHAASPRKANPRVKPKQPTRHASHKAKPKHKATTRHKATPKHKNKKASKSKSSKKHTSSKKQAKSKAHSKKKQSFIAKLWTSAKKKVKAAVHKAAKKVKKAVHHAVKAVNKAAKTVKKFVQKHSTAIFTGLSVAAVVLSFTPLAPLGIAMDVGLTAWSAYNAISGKDLLSGAHLSNGARIGYGAGVLLSVAGPLVGKIAGKGIDKLVEMPAVAKALGKVSDGAKWLKASKAGQVASKLYTLKNLGSKVSESVAGKALNKASTTIMKPLNKANDAYESAAEKIKGLFTNTSKIGMNRFTGTLGPKLTDEEFNKISKDFLDHGGVIQRSKATDEYLDRNNSIGTAYNENTILLHSNADKSALLEEIEHTKQYKAGMSPKTDHERTLMEIEAKENVLKLANKYKLSAEEIKETKLQIEIEKEKLKKYEG